MTKKLTQNMTPLFTAMENYVADGAKAYHTPGHKQGLGIPKEMLKAITPYGLQMEVSLMEELDDIHGATHCLKDAQDLAAELYGANSTAFFINGTTGAIQAMIMAAVNPGDEILIPRNAHSSVLGALVLIGAKPIYIQPEINEQWGIPMNIDPEEVEKILCKHPNIKAMVLVHPTYYGVASDIEKIVHLLHQRQIPLLVDEAHGAHFEFHSSLPISALRAGADMVAQSTHKSLGSLTQTSLLHFNSKLISKERFLDSASLLQSTSPNYLLMASLDLARQQMALEGYKLWDRTIKLAKELRTKINGLANLSSFNEDIFTNEGSYAFDPTKVTVNFTKLGLTGEEVEQILRHEYKIQCELADAHNVLFLFSYADTEDKFQIIYAALKDLNNRYQNNSQTLRPLTIPPLPPIPKMAITPRDVLFKAKKQQEFSHSAGFIAGERISFYPPGIPLIYPGEIISQELIDYVNWRKNHGGNLKGPMDKDLKYIRILEE